MYKLLLFNVCNFLIEKRKIPLKLKGNYYFMLHTTSIQEFMAVYCTDNNKRTNTEYI